MILKLTEETNETLSKLQENNRQLEEARERLANSPLKSLANKLSPSAPTSEDYNSAGVED
jgi:hypothetical protein